ncbi:MAG: hypothetical protein DMF86_14645 [Acidobacteria bacterium]|nr:MAG: hypothetical protein DMF86_14645 [Acidobacteriota bacterium]
MSESMGPIADRSREHLGPSDIMIIRTRMRLIRAVQAFRDRRETPVGVDDPARYRQHSGSIILPRSADWAEATRDLRMAPVEESKV